MKILLPVLSVLGAIHVASAQNTCQNPVKNVKSLTADEKKEIVDAILRMKSMNSTYSPEENMYDYFPQLHLVATIPSANIHAAFGFLPWHREYDRRFYEELKKASNGKVTVRFFPSLWCGCVVVWLCGCVVVWLCGCVVVWLCGCVVVWFLVALVSFTLS